MKFNFKKLATAYFTNIPTINNRTVSIDVRHVESLQQLNGKTWIRMASGQLHISLLKKREVAKLFGARVK